MTIDEVPYEDVLKLRQEVMYPDKDIDFVKLPEDQKGLHMGAFENGKLISVMSVFLDNRSLQFRKLATKEEMQKKGYASALMKWLIDYAVDMKFNRIWCNSRAEACTFYQKFGYNKTDERFTKNGYEYIIMERKF